MIDEGDSYTIGTAPNDKTFTVRYDDDKDCYYVEWIDQALTPETSDGAGDEQTFEGEFTSSPRTALWAATT